MQADPRPPRPLRVAVRGRIGATLGAFLAGTASLGSGALTGCNAILGNEPGVLVNEGGPDASSAVFDASVFDAGRTSEVEGGPAVEGDAAFDAAPDAPSNGDAGGTCAAGRKDCSAECVSAIDPLYGCASDTCDPCALRRATSNCAAGRCVVARCEAGYADCNQDASDGCETDLSLPTHCGACNAVCPASAPVCAPNATGFACGTGCAAQARTRCGAQCVNLEINANHCGACGNACPAVDNAVVRCERSSCAFTCNPGLHACGGVCVRNQSPDHCGASCTPCPAPANAEATCAGGACGFRCEAGFHRCGDACVSDGSPASCGASCAPCAAVANGTAICTAGQCGTACNAGFHACGATCASNTDPATCGTSCTPCPTGPNATATCSGAGACGLECAAGSGDCDGAAGNGCEVSLNSDPAHCGTCSTVCNGTACVNAQCDAPPPSDAGDD